MNNPTITIQDLRNSGALVTTVPTIAQMKKENRIREAEMRKAELESLSKEELDKEMQKGLPMHEVVNVMIDYVHELYPDCSFLVLGSQPKNDYTNITIEDRGDPDKISTAISESMQKNQNYLNLFNKAIQYFCRTSSPSEAERAITGLQDIITDLKKNLDPDRQITMKLAEIKRLRKAGRLDLVKIKEAEINQIRTEINAKKEAEEKKASLREKRLAALAKGRETVAANREKARRAKQNPPQPNFAKMAKKKRQEIAARQAEKKKKKAAGGENVKSCSQLLK